MPHLQGLASSLVTERWTAWTAVESSPCSDALLKKEAPARFHKDGQTLLAMYSTSPVLRVFLLIFFL